MAKASNRTESFTQSTAVDLETGKGEGEEGSNCSNNHRPEGQHCCSYHAAVIRASPSVLLVPIAVFVVLCGAGLVLCLTLDNSQELRLENEALALAEETGQWFSDHLDQAILPLFSMAQFVSELDIFHDLPEKIGPAFAPGSLPFLPPPGSGSDREEKVIPTHRNITGVCDEPALVKRFTEIANTIKKNAKMEGILVNIQLAPEAVVCLLHPVNNTEDFESPVFMDNSGALGHDLLTDPKRSFIAKATLPAEDVVIAGPLTLRQCKECDPTVEKAFIARLPIVSKRHTIEVDGVAYKRWGFAVVLINWQELVTRSQVYQMASERGFEFRLTRTDRNFDAETDSYVEKVVVLAETPGYNLNQKRRQHVVAELETTNNQWVMTVAYEPLGDRKWKAFIFLATIFSSLFVSVLLYVVLFQKHRHTDQLAEKSALLVEQARQATVSERELNDYIAHEVRNPLSAAIQAGAFVTATLNDEANLDARALESAREDMGMIDSSLSFINELLRGMLDVHRAFHNKMTLDMVEVDMLHDVLEPASSMFYRRDENFEVILDCPKNLVIVTDRLRLQQVVLNLARNAAKFVSVGYIRLRACCENGSVHVYVEDSGPGIPEAKRANLFRRFQVSLDNLSQGTGIGLSLCKTLVDNMQGDIYLDETYHSGIQGHPGTRIVIDLKRPPVKQHQEALLSLGGTSTRSMTNSMTSSSSAGSELSTFDDEFTAATTLLTKDLPKEFSVLFVDDERILRKLALRAIRTILPDWTVHEAASGEAAVKLVSSDKKKFDLIFMDQYMTSTQHALKGTEAVRALRSAGVESIICGVSANDLEKSFMSAGANSFLMKPFPGKPEDLTDELCRILKPHKKI